MLSLKGIIVENSYSNSLVKFIGMSHRQIAHVTISLSFTS